MSLITADPALAREKLHTAPFALKHGLANHPLFALPRLVDLAQSLPRDRIEYNSGRLEPGTRPEDVPGLDMAPADVIARIEAAGAWMVIKSVQEDADYGGLLKTFLADALRLAGRSLSECTDLQGFIFVSSARSVTPFHLDAEENILVQITGDKFAHVFDNRDRSLIAEAAMEISPSKHRNQPYQEAFEARAQVFALSAGDGVHLPYMWPHWIRNGERPSISMAMTWKTPDVLRLNKIRLMNGTLRRLRLPQPPPGAAPLSDAAKVFAHDALRLALDPLRKSQSLRRALRRAVYGRHANYYLDAAKKGGM